MESNKSISFGFSKISENRVLKSKYEYLDGNAKEETDYVTSLEDKEVKRFRFFIISSVRFIFCQEGNASSLRLPFVPILQL